MDVIDVLTVNGENYIFSNPTDCYVDRYLYSSYGFVLYYRPKKGIANTRWHDMLKRNGYGMKLQIRKNILYVETRNTTFDIWDYVDRPFVVEWVLDDCWHSLAFDGKEFVMQDNDGNLWLPGVVL